MIPGNSTCRYVKDRPISTIVCWLQLWLSSLGWREATECGIDLPLVVVAQQLRGPTRVVTMTAVAVQCAGNVSMQSHSISSKTTVVASSQVLCLDASTSEP